MLFGDISFLFGGAFIGLAWGALLAIFCGVLLRGILLRLLVAVFGASGYAITTTAHKPMLLFGLPKCYTIP